MKAAMVVLALATSAFALPAAAQLNMSSVYIGGSLGRSDFRVPDERDTAWRIFGGYQLNRNFAAEVGYHNLGSVHVPGGEYGTNLWELVGVGMLPVANALSVYGKLGGYYGKTRVPGRDDNNGGLTYGIGAQYDFMRQAAVRLEWQRYDKVGNSNTGETDVDVLNVGLLYKFQ
jgi:OOP family OmpA-OmpF porin